MTQENLIDLNEMNDLNAEVMPDLTDFADEPGGAWPKGWYTAEVIEGYATAKGKQFITEDNPSKDGTSRNMRLCFRVTKGSDTRQLQESFNYRPTDFTAERLQFIKEAREEFKGVKGAWADRDAQRSSLAIAKLGQLQKALGGIKLPLTAAHTINPASIVGSKLDVYLTIDENGYNEVKQFAPASSKTSSKRS